MSSAKSTVLSAADAEPPSTLRVKPMRKKPDASSGWKCLHCCKPFSSKYIVERHSKKCSETIKKPCVDVNLECKLYIGSSLSSNVLNKTGPTTKVAKVRKPKPRHLCAACEKSFGQKHDLVYHIKTYHPSLDVEAVCPVRKKNKNLKCPGKQICCDI